MSDTATLGVECDVDDCEERVAGLDDGYEFSRGVVCQSCIDYQTRHGHWPDDDVEICVECKIDAGAVSHECPDAGAVDSVLVDAGEDCPYCGETQRKVATDGGTASAGADRIAFASLAFAEEHVAPIRRGEKTATLRLPGEYDAAVVHAAERGSEVLLTTPDGEPFARAAMRGRFELSPVGIARLATLPGYPAALESADDVLRILERHYGAEIVDDATMVDVLTFDVTELLRRETVEVSAR